MGMTCECEIFCALELDRDAVTERIRETRKIRRRLTLVAEQPAGEHKLYKCDRCGQMWQISRAWNWGNYRYAFKVPTIQIDEWISEPYIQPDELFLFNAMMENFMGKNQFVKSDAKCKVNGCQQFANQYSVFCLEHHIESLQRAGALPGMPEGKWFLPYER